MRARARAEQEERERARKEKEEREKTQPQGLQRVEEDEDAESDGIILVESSDTKKTKRRASGKSGASATQAKKSKPSPEPINLIDSDTEDEDARGGAPFLDAPTSLSSSTTTTAAPPDTQANAAGEGDRIRLTLRSSTGSTLSVNVRRTTTFRRMLEHFASTAEKDGTARKAGMTAASIVKKARMVWDGETMKLDGAVGDVEELEEDELIDVLW